MSDPLRLLWGVDRRTGGPGVPGPSQRSGVFLASFDMKREISCKIWICMLQPSGPSKLSLGPPACPGGSWSFCCWWKRADRSEHVVFLTRHGLCWAMTSRPTHDTERGLRLRPETAPNPSNRAQAEESNNNPAPVDVSADRPWIKSGAERPLCCVQVCATTALLQALLADCVQAGSRLEHRRILFWWPSDLRGNKVSLHATCSLTQAITPASLSGFHQIKRDQNLVKTRFYAAMLIISKLSANDQSRGVCGTSGFVLQAVAQLRGSHRPCRRVSGSAPLTQDLC